jgi:hypothetical protein
MGEHILIQAIGYYQHEWSIAAGECRPDWIRVP